MFVGYYAPNTLHDKPVEGSEKRWCCINKKGEFRAYEDEGKAVKWLNTK